MPLEPTQKTQIIAEHAKAPGDTGSPEVQIAIMSTRINEINDHLKDQPSDHAARRGLLRLVGRRGRLLEYLRRKDIERYRDISQKMGIRTKKGGTA